MAHLVPVGTVLMGVPTMVVCVAMVLTEGQYIGGIPWPYLSDTGRERPAYYIFAVGLSLTGAFAAASNVLFWQKVYGREPHKPSMVSLVLGCGSRACCSPYAVALTAMKLVVLSAFFLVLLACFDTNRYPDIHQYSAYGFFILQTVALTLYIIADNTRYRSAKLSRTPVDAAVARAHIFRNVLYAIYAVAFLIYLPIGLSVNCAWFRLSMADCIDVEQLGETYCESIPLAGDSSRTLLWDYSGCPRSNTMRSATQFICVITLILFHGSMSVDIRNETDWGLDDAENPAPRKMKTMLGM